MPIGSLQKWGEPVRVGVACHHRADAVFHDLPEFVLGARALTRDLLDRGLPRGAARAVGHAGWELLLDGVLVRDDAFLCGYFAALAVDVPDRAWRVALDRRAQRGAPTFYAQPEGVAELLRRILNDRPRLAFDATHTGAVAAALRTAQSGVEQSAGDVFAAVTPAGG